MGSAGVECRCIKQVGMPAGRKGEVLQASDGPYVCRCGRCRWPAGAGFRPVPVAGRCRPVPGRASEGALGGRPVPAGAGPSEGAPGAGLCRAYIPCDRPGPVAGRCRWPRPVPVAGRCRLPAGAGWES